jgi:hypothetical protein
MKKIIFALCLLSAAQAYQNTSFAQIIPTEEPMADPDLPPTKADLFKKFAKISLPLNLEIITEAEAQKIIKEKNISYISSDLLNAFFPIPIIKNPKIGAQALLYYPYGYIEINTNTKIFLCLEDWGDEVWKLQAYSFKNEETFIDALTISQAQLKASIKADATISISQKTARELENVGGTQTISAYYTATAKYDTGGKFSPFVEGEFKGIEIYPQADFRKALPEGIYAEGTVLEAIHWRDAFAEHYAVTSFIAADNNAVTRTNTAISLRFYHYAKKKGETRFNILHQSVSNAKACPLDIEAFLLPQKMLLSDIDKNNILEVFIPHWLDCPDANFASLNMQLIMWEGQREYFQHALADNKTNTAKYTFTSAWSRLSEAIRNHAAAVLKQQAANLSK